MLIFTSDTHGDDSRFYEPSLPGESLFGADDFVIIPGDCGLVFQPEYPVFTMGYVEEKLRLNALEQKPYTILFVDGNHENFDRLNAFPVEERFGGRVHRIRKNIFHLMRGEIYDILGYRIFVFGGALSHDRGSRRLGVTYWKEELPCQEEYDNALKNLAAVGNKVDIIVTHTMPLSAMQYRRVTPDERERRLVGFLDYVYHEVDFERWFFGHWHEEIELGRLRGLYFDSVRLPSRLE